MCTTCEQPRLSQLCRVAWQAGLRASRPGCVMIADEGGVRAVAESETSGSWPLARRTVPMREASAASFGERLSACSRKKKPWVVILSSKILLAK